MHGGRELLREEKLTEMEDVKGAPVHDFDQWHSIAPEATKKARKAPSGSAKRTEHNARLQAGINLEKGGASSLKIVH